MLLMARIDNGYVDIDFDDSHGYSAYKMIV